MPTFIDTILVKLKMGGFIKKFWSKSQKGLVKKLIFFWFVLILCFPLFSFSFLSVASAQSPSNFDSKNKFLNKLNSIADSITDQAQTLPGLLSASDIKLPKIDLKFSLQSPLQKFPKIGINISKIKINIPEELKRSFALPQKYLDSIEKQFGLNKKSLTAQITDTSPTPTPTPSPTSAVQLVSSPQPGNIEINIDDSSLVVDHKLFKPTRSSKIYFYQNSSLHLVPDTSTLESLGFMLNDAFEISPETFALFKIGTPIETVIIPFSDKQITGVKSLFQKFFKEETLGQGQPVLASLIQLSGDLEKIKSIVNRSIPQNFSFSGGGGSATTTVGGNNAELIGDKLTIDNIQINGNAISATSGNVELPATTKLNSVAYTWPSADGSSNQRLTTNGSGVLSWATTTSGVSSNSLDFDEFVNTMTLDANLTINRGTGNYFFGIGAAPTTVFEVQGTASASYLLTGNTLQVGGYSSVAYSRFGTSTTTHSGSITTTNDLLISGDLEVDGSAAFDGFTLLTNASISNSFELTSASSLLGINSGAKTNTMFEVGGTASISGATTLNQITYTWPSADGSSSQVLQTNGSGTLSWASASSRPASNSLDWDEFVNTSLLDANLTINRGGFKVGLGKSPSTVFEVGGTASASYLLTGNTLQVGGFASVAYSRFGTSTTTHGNYISTTNDLLISGDLSVIGTASFGGIASISNALFLPNNGNVGIGTTGPVGPLEISITGIPTTANQDIRLTQSNNTHAPPNIGFYESATRRAYVGWNEAIGYLDYSCLYNGTCAHLWSTYSGASVTEKMRLTAAGNLGIGTKTPTSLLTVQGRGEFQGTASASYLLTSNTLHVGSFSSSSYRFFVVDPNLGSTATGSFAIRSSNTVGSVASISATSLTSGSVFQITVPASASGNDAGGVLDVKDVNGATMASLSFGGRLALRGGILSRGAVSTCTGAAANGCIDLAEEFPLGTQTNADSKPTAGDLLSMDVNDGETATVKKAESPYDKNILGIVTTNPGVVLSDNVYTGTTAQGYRAKEGNVIVALAGRVPVKVSNENGEIKKGDYLTSSSVPGIAMKATKPGRVVGIALENNKNGLVMTFINPHWLGRNDASSQLADLSSQAAVNSDNTNTINDFVNYLKDAVLTVKKLIANVVESRDGFETKDQTTGEKYCITVNNGQIAATKGECGQSLPTLTPILPVSSPTLDVGGTESNVLDLSAPSNDGGQIGTTPSPTPELPTL